ncbi:MAG: FtsX-like permease family protein [Clostridia bacterium]|nr:FtsX-like permease family protein [Clostridia bacterium]
MEILTLLKANIRHKKGSFVSIIILMLLVSMSFTAVFSLKDNCANGINEAHEYINSSDLTILIDNQLLTDDLLTSIEEHSSVEDVKVKEAVLTFGSEYGESKNVNPGLLETYSEEFRLLNEKLTGYEENVPELKKGEIYVSQGVGTKMHCDIGDSIKINTVGGEEYFTIKGFVVEPLWGSMNMGIKEMFISDEDFLRLQQDAVNMSTPQQQAEFRVVSVYKADESLGDGQFKHQLNEDTGIVKYSFFVLTKEQSVDYTNIMPDMILSGLLIFVGFLVGIVLIVMAHSITTSIEMEYTTLGVLKAQGFTEGKIRVVLGAQYLVAEIIGAVLGMAAAFPMIKFFGNIFQPFLAVICENNISWSISVLFVVTMLVVSAIFIFFVTRKVGKVSPMKAISGGNDDVYFGSRLNAPVSQKALSASLAFRQFTSNKRRYIGTVIIVALLTFFMITMSILGVSLDSKSAMESMGMGPMELRVQADESLTENTVKDIEEIIEKKTKIERRYFYDNYQMLINGNEYLSNIYKNSEFIVMKEGRAPEYDNEIAVTDFLAKELDLKIGDKVTISRQNYEYEYLITGINIYANELGLNFSIPLEGAKKLGIEDTLFYGYSLADETNCNELAEEINEKYGDILAAKGYESDPNIEMYSSIVDAMTYVIYVVSVVFSLVVVMMFCKKAFLQERRDIGIYKSLGFTSAKLRLQFAVRFLIVSLIGSALGSVLSILFTEKLLTVIFKMVGISSFNTQFTPMAFIIPVAIIAVSFFAFSYMASGKIKKVEVKELVIE